MKAKLCSLFWQLNRIAAFVERKRAAR